MLSFVVAGFACAFAALCYAEFASMVPVAGSAYTYAYATLGELFAWIIGWDLLLNMASARPAWRMVGRTTSSIFSICRRAILPAAFTNAPFDFNPASGAFVATGAIIDVPALLISAVLTVDAGYRHSRQRQRSTLLWS